MIRQEAIKYVINTEHTNAELYCVIRGERESLKVECIEALVALGITKEEVKDVYPTYLDSSIAWL